MSILPKGPAPAPLALPHFPDRMHAFVWRNWGLVPTEKIARVLQASESNIAALAESMGLPKEPRITKDQQRRSYLTVIKRNWHLLPYEQLLELLGWSAEQLAYTLREDDFLYIKLGSLKPKCEPLRYEPPNETARTRAKAMRETLQKELGGMREPSEPLFAFVEDLSKVPQSKPQSNKGGPVRFCYSYFALYGDPLLEPDVDPYPSGYLARLAESGVTGVWLQAVLYKLAPFPWDAGLSKNYGTRLANLKKLVARAADHGIGVYLYLNEPRSMPLRFFDAHPELKGVTKGDQAALCTSQNEVRDYLTKSIDSICQAVPKLGGFFTITASENFTSCWSHGGGAKCPRCGKRSAGEVIAEVNSAIFEGIRQSKSDARLIAWDWGWDNTWAEDAINRLPQGVTFQSVSEWDLPITRGGVNTTVGEYSISAIGPGPRAKRHWAAAKKRGLNISAKIQAGNTWELSAVPYIPAVRNVAQHAANLRELGIENIMLGWTLGGYPSPNLEVVHEVARTANDSTIQRSNNSTSVDQAMLAVAERRFGKQIAPHVVKAWNAFSAAFTEFPYHGEVVYDAPLQLGPANLLWEKKTGYHASMVGFPYDDVDRWRSIYPAKTFAEQLEKVGSGFNAALRELRQSTEKVAASPAEQSALAAESRVAEAAAFHFFSVATQARFVLARETLAGLKDAERANIQTTKVAEIIRSELNLARRLYELQCEDSRLGFEASNQYYYVPQDLAEKILNCRDLIDRWLPAERAKRA